MSLIDLLARNDGDVDRHAMRPRHLGPRGNGWVRFCQQDDEDRVGFVPAAIVEFDLLLSGESAGLLFVGLCESVGELFSGRDAELCVCVV
jgi:hypothetical protein